MKTISDLVLVAVGMSFALTALEAKADATTVETGTIVDWEESGDYFYFDDHVDRAAGIGAEWSIQSYQVPSGWFYGRADSSVQVARVTGISLPCQITDASSYTYGSTVGGVRAGDFVVLRSTATGYYAAFRVSSIDGSAPTPTANLTWYFQTDRTDNFGPCDGPGEPPDEPDLPASVEVGTFNGWDESGEYFYFDDYVTPSTGIAGWWSIQSYATPSGWFYGVYGSNQVARVTGISEVCQITDASSYAYGSSVGGVVAGDFVVLRSTTTGYYGAFRVDALSGGAVPTQRTDVTWYLQTNGTDSFGPCNAPAPVPAAGSIGLLALLAGLLGLGALRSIRAPARADTPLG